jgi:hypothetical protein
MMKRACRPPKLQVNHLGWTLQPLPQHRW